MGLNLAFVDERGGEIFLDEGLGDNLVRETESMGNAESIDFGKGPGEGEPCRSKRDFSFRRLRLRSSPESSSDRGHGFCFECASSSTSDWGSLRERWCLSGDLFDLRSFVSLDL